MIKDQRNSFSQLFKGIKDIFNAFIVDLNRETITRD